MATGSQGAAAWLRSREILALRAALAAVSQPAEAGLHVADVQLVDAMMVEFEGRAG